MRNLFAKLQISLVDLWRRLVNRRRLAMLLIPFGLATGRATGSDDTVLWTPVHQKPTDRTRNDLELTLRARRLLLEDSALARYDIQVRIDDRVAELSGQVPSMDIAQRAEGSLRGLLGLASIRNRLSIDATGQSGTARDQMRVDWGTPQLETVNPYGAVPQLASRYSAISGEPAFSWRPVRRVEEVPIFAVPFVPEGIGRPNVNRDQFYESEASSRENLRIGRVDVVKSPVEYKEEPGVSLMPPVDIGQLEATPTRPTPRLLDQIRSRVPFIGF